MNLRTLTTSTFIISVEMAPLKKIDRTLTCARNINGPDLKMCPTQVANYIARFSKLRSRKKYCVSYDLGMLDHKSSISML